MAVKVFRRFWRNEYGMTLVELIIGLLMLLITVVMLWVLVDALGWLFRIAHTQTGSINAELLVAFLVGFFLSGMLQFVGSLVKRYRKPKDAPIA